MASRRVYVCDWCAVEALGREGYSDPRPDGWKTKPVRNDTDAQEVCSACVKAYDEATVAARVRVREERKAIGVERLRKTRR